jgi:hypothetical protein
VNLATYEAAGELYLARGDDVNPNRPVFTGDVYHNVAIPGVQDKGMGLVVAHPCSFRIGDGQLAERVLTASVESVAKQGPRAWTKMFSDRMPLTDLEGEHSYWAGHLDKIGRALASDLLATERLACLSAFGVNMLQQERRKTLQAQLYTRINPGTGRTWGRDEPGWNSRSVEEPSLIATWMSRCLGGASPNLVANLSGVWPSDIVAMMIGAEKDDVEFPQEPLAPVKRMQVDRDGTSEVIDLRAWRRRA